MTFTVAPGRVMGSGNLRWEVRDERGVSYAECYTQGFAERLAAALNNQIPPALWKALEQWDRLANSDSLTQRGLAMEELINVVRQMVNVR